MHRPKKKGFKKKKKQNVKKKDPSKNQHRSPEKTGKSRKKTLIEGGRCVGKVCGSQKDTKNRPSERRPPIEKWDQARPWVRRWEGRMCETRNKRFQEMLSRKKKKLSKRATRGRQGPSYTGGRKRGWGLQVEPTKAWGCKKRRKRTVCRPGGGGDRKEGKKDDIDEVMTERRRKANGEGTCKEEMEDHPKKNLNLGPQEAAEKCPATWKKR